MRRKQAEWARRGYRQLPRVQDLHPIHQATGRVAAGCRQCEAGQDGRPEPSMEDSYREQPTD